VSDALQTGAAGPILIVEDDEAIRETLTAVLEDEGYLVQCAAHGREALQQLRSGAQLPCLILLDLMMPIMSGWDFRAEQLRDPALAGIPVIVLSADNEVQARASEVRAQGYLSKPMDLTALVDAVRPYCA
jgi:CheY-like chemotaxis protein